MVVNVECAGLDGRRCSAEGGGERKRLRRGMVVMIMEFRSDDDGEDDEVEEEIEARRCEACEDKGSDGWSFVENEV